MAPVGRTLWVALAVVVATLGCDLWDQNTSPVAPTGTVLTIRANPTSLSLDGVSEITVVATHSSGVPARTGTEIRFSTDLGTFDQIVVPTDGQGVARTMLRADGRAGTARVRAVSGTEAAMDGTNSQVSVAIGTAALTAAFESEVGAGLTVAFKDKSTGDPTAWEWDFGDDTHPVNRTQPDPAHTYQEEGTYLVRLIVRNPDGEDSASEFVTVPASDGMLSAADFTSKVDGTRSVMVPRGRNNR